MVEEERELELYQRVEGFPPPPSASASFFFFFSPPHLSFSLSLAQFHYDSFLPFRSILSLLLQ